MIREIMNREDYIEKLNVIFGIPSCFIEGLLVGRRYEHDNEQLKLLKKYFPNCYICNLDGVVINI